MSESNLRALTEAYLQALAENDLSQCMDFYSEDATIHFQPGVFQGAEDIREWHRSRFDADMQIVEVGPIGISGNTVTLDGTVTSRRLKAWRIGKLKGTATLKFEADKIKEARFALRAYNFLEGW